MHQPDPGRLDELPGFLDLVRRDAGGIGRGRLVVPAQEGQALPAIQPGDEPRRRATERSAAIEQQQRPARRRNIPEPRALEYEAIHGSRHSTLGGLEPTILASPLLTIGLALRAGRASARIPNQFAASPPFPNFLELVSK
jgi:hypothetical protein